MRVLLFCEGLTWASARAQPWRHVIEISKRMKNTGHEVQILSDAKQESNADKQIQGFPIERVKRKGRLLNINEVLNKMSEKEADIINWHGSDIWSSYYLSELGGDKDLSVVWTLHSGPISTSDLRNLKFSEFPQLYKYWNNILNAVLPSAMIRRWVNCSRVKQIITLSRRLSQHLSRKGVNVKGINVIPSGVDTKRFKPLDQKLSRENLSLPPEAEIILYFGPLSSFRGVDTLIEAAPLIRNRVPSAKLLLLGRGAETNLKQTKKANPTFIETRSASLSEEEIILYLDAADVVVLPFRFWPQVECPLTVLESMAMKKPVVTTYAGAISEIVSSGENGVLVPPRDTFTLAREIIRVLKDEEFRNYIGTNARQLVENSFDWDIIVKRTLNVFDKALDN